MPLSRRRLLHTTAAAAAGAALRAAGAGGERALPPDGWDAPDAWAAAADALGGPISIEAIDVVSLRGRRRLRVRSSDGAVGAAPDNGRLGDARSLLEGRVARGFLGQDARRLPELVDRVYHTPRSNYKFAGMPFWTSVAAVEIATLDLVGRRLGLPAARLIGDPIRESIPVYVTRLTRETTPAEEVRIAAEQLAATGASAVKLKIGGRMRNRPQDAERTSRLVPLARRELGDSVAIYVDANGSYSVSEAIEVARMLEDHGVGFFEEPCPWEEHDATRRVAEAARVPIAGGEQDSSLPAWRWMIRNRGFDLCQPDVFYAGGLFRSLRIARWAAEAGLDVTPHSPKGGTQQHAMLSLAAVLPNLGPHQECLPGPDVVRGRRDVPSGPGLDWGVEDAELRAAPLA
ncbi:MAG: mandelate racemase/muconate lactonizing enzyme family protein [Planctomycetota bacterium]